MVLYFFSCVVHGSDAVDSHERKYPAALFFAFFNYQSDFDTDIFGVAWYLTTMMRLYILAPLVFLLLEKIKSRRMNLALLFVLLLASLAARIWMRSYILRTSGSWDFEVYAVCGGQ